MSRVRNNLLQMASNEVGQQPDIQATPEALENMCKMMDTFCKTNYPTGDFSLDYSVMVPSADGKTKIPYVVQALAAHFGVFWPGNVQAGQTPVNIGLWLQSSVGHLTDDLMTTIEAHLEVIGEEKSQWVATLVDKVLTAGASDKEEEILFGVSLIICASRTLNLEDKLIFDGVRHIFRVIRGIQKKAGKSPREAEFTKVADDIVKNPAFTGKSTVASLIPDAFGVAQADIDNAIGVAYMTMLTSFFQTVGARLPTEQAHVIKSMNGLRPKSTTIELLEFAAIAPLDSSRFNAMDKVARHCTAVMFVVQQSLKFVHRCCRFYASRMTSNDPALITRWESILHFTANPPAGLVLSLTQKASGDLCTILYLLVTYKKDIKLSGTAYGQLIREHHHRSDALNNWVKNRVNLPSLTYGGLMEEYIALKQSQSGIGGLGLVLTEPGVVAPAGAGAGGVPGAQQQPGADDALIDD